MRRRCPSRPFACIAEAPTLEPLVALRRFVENALAPDPPTEIVERILAPPHRRPRSRSRAWALAGRRPAPPSTPGTGSRSSCRRPSSSTERRTSSSTRRTARLLAERIPDARLELFPGLRAPPLLGRAAAVRRGRGRVPRVNGQHTIGRWLADRARNTPNRVAIDFAGSAADVRGARRALGGHRGGARRPRRRAWRSGRDAHRELTRPRRAALRVRAARARPPAARTGGSPRTRSVTSSTTRRRPSSSSSPSTPSSHAAREAAFRASRSPSSMLDRPVPPASTSRTTTRCSSRTRPGRPASRRARCSRTRTASGRTSRSTARAGSPTVTSCSRCCRSSTPAAGTCSRSSPGGRARRSSSSRRSTRPVRSRLIEEKRVTTMMGVPATYLFMAEQPEFATVDLSSLRLAVVGGAPMPESLLETWHERGRRDRPGLRPDRGRAERALPAAGRRRPQARLRRQAVPARRRGAPRSRIRGRTSTARRRESSSCAGRTCSPGTGETRRRPQRRSPTAGSSPATSPSATTRATTGSSAG